MPGELGQEPGRTLPAAAATAGGGQNPGTEPQAMQRLYIPHPTASPLPLRPRCAGLTWTMALEPITSKTCPLRLVPLGSMKFTISAYWANCRDRIGVRRVGGLLSPPPDHPLQPLSASPASVSPPVVGGFVLPATGGGHSAADANGQHPPCQAGAGRTTSPGRRRCQGGRSCLPLPHPGSRARLQHCSVPQFPQHCRVPPSPKGCSQTHRAPQSLTTNKFKPLSLPEADRPITCIKQCLREPPKAHSQPWINPPQSWWHPSGTPQDTTPHPLPGPHGTERPRLPALLEAVGSHIIPP